MRKLTDLDLDRLGSFMIGLDEAMMLSTLDGFLSGVVVCPDLIRQKEWLPVVWGGEGPVFDSIDEANEILALIMARYNEIIHGLGRPGMHQPILDPDTDGAPLWEIWAEGFAAAVALRPDSWRTFEASENEVVRNSFDALVGLAFRVADGKRDENDFDAELRRNASALIASCLHSLNAARLKSDASRASVAPSPVARHVGRNDPCPCGSGKKFKKCCLN